MQQSQWRTHIQELIRELKGNSTLAVQQFGIRLGKTLEREFPAYQALDVQLTPRQKAFIHALQLYELDSVVRLVAHYDLSQDPPVGIVPRIQKSCNSLAVSHLLNPFHQTPEEKRALTRYRKCLQDGLQKILICSVEDLHSTSHLHSLLNKAHKIPPKEQQIFLIERLKALFSREYQVYLILKNRYFLSRLHQCLEQATPCLWLQQQLQSSRTSSAEQSIEQQLDNLNYREIETLVRQMSAQFPELAEQPPLPKKTQEQFLPTNSLTIATKEEVSPSAELQKKFAVQTAVTTYTFADLCRHHSKNLHYLLNKLALVPECSSPYFRAKSEDYTSEYPAIFFHFFHENKEIFQQCQKMIEVVLQEDSVQKTTRKRTEIIPVFVQNEQKEWFAIENIERAKEWSLMFFSRLPFTVYFRDTDGIEQRLEKGRGFVFHLGIGYFDQDLTPPQWKETQTTLFFRLLFRGHKFFSNAAVIYLEQEPFFTIPTRQSLPFRRLIQLMWIVIYLKFSLAIPKVVQQYLIEQLR